MNISSGPNSFSMTSALKPSQLSEILLLLTQAQKLNPLGRSHFCLSLLSNPAGGSRRIVNFQPTPISHCSLLNPANGSWRIVKVLPCMPIKRSLQMHHFVPVFHIATSFS